MKTCRGVTPPARGRGASGGLPVRVEAQVNRLSDDRSNASAAGPGLSLQLGVSLLVEEEL